MNTSHRTSSASAASLAEQAYYTIRDLILRGKLPLGAALSRRRLAAELGMSMLPISEAVQRLEREGLLESKPQVGTRVRIPTEQDVRGRFVIREALEGQAARLFAERASLQQRQELGRIAEQVDALFNRRASGDCDSEFVSAIHSCHFQLHMKIAESTGCAALRQMIEESNVLVLNWLYDLVGQQPVPPPRFHRDLIAILSGDDPGAADAAMRQHVRWGIEETVQSILRIKPHSGGKWRLRAASTCFGHGTLQLPLLSSVLNPSTAHSRSAAPRTEPRS